MSEKIEIISKEIKNEGRMRRKIIKYEKMKKNSGIDVNNSIG